MGVIYHDPQLGKRHDFSVLDEIEKSALDRGVDLAELARGMVGPINWIHRAVQYHLRKALGIPVSDTMEIAEEKDRAQAAYWYNKAADQEYAASYNNLGILYQYGYGVAVDSAAAIELYRKAAERGHKLAQINLEDAEK